MADEPIDPEVEYILNAAGFMLRMSGESNEYKAGVMAGALTAVTDTVLRWKDALEKAGAENERLREQVRQAYMSGYREGRKDAFKEMNQ